MALGERGARLEDNVNSGLDTQDLWRARCGRGADRNTAIAAVAAVAAARRSLQRTVDTRIQYVAVRRVWSVGLSVDCLSQIPSLFVSDRTKGAMRRRSGSIDKYGRLRFDDRWSGCLAASSKLEGSWSRRRG